MESEYKIDIVQLLGGIENFSTREEFRVENISKMSLEELKTHLAEFDKQIDRTRAYINALERDFGDAKQDEIRVSKNFVRSLIYKKAQLERRKRKLESEESFENIQELIQETVSDEKTKERLRKELEQYQLNSQKIIEFEQNKAESAILQAEQLKMEMLERRSKVFRSFLEKESASTLIGAALVILIVIAHIVSFFRPIEVPLTLDNAFLIILGYFFGQSTNQNSNRS